MKPQCPHCQTFLRDRKNLPVTWMDWAILMALLLLMQTLSLPRGFGLAGMLALAGFYLLRWQRATSRVRSEEERYAVEPDSKSPNSSTEA